MGEMIRYLIVALFVNLFISLHAQPIFDSRTIKSVELNNFNIRGETNVNKFDIRYFENEGTNTQIKIQRTDHFDWYSLAIPIDQLKYSNMLMRNDFLTLVKAEQYPTINIKLNLDKVNFSIQKQCADISDIIITLAGVKSHYNLHCVLQKQSNTKYVLLGDQKIQLSDFNLVPPEKFLGMVKVKDQVFISFDLHLDLANN